MLQGIYTAAAGMLAHDAMADVIANNLANVASPGFKQDFATFHMASDHTDAAGGVSRAPMLTYQAYTDFRPGSLTPSQNKLDLAFGDTGDNFFVVETQDGERYTRAGNFTRDVDGRLITSNNQPVLGVDGHIFLGDGDVTFTENGNVLVDKQPVGKLKIVQFDRINGHIPIQKEGHNLFAPISSQSVARLSSHPNVKQGVLEGSNVGVMDQMARMIHIARGYESYQRSVLVADSSLNMLIQRVGGG